MLAEDASGEDGPRRLNNEDMALGCTRVTQDYRGNSMILRSWRRCGIWLLISGICITISAYYALTEAPRVNSIAVWFVALYSFQALIAELAGVKMSGSGILFPRRISSTFGMLTFWRAKVAAQFISRIDVLDNSTILVNGTLKIALANRDQQRRIRRFTKLAYPWVDVF